MSAEHDPTTFHASMLDHLAAVARRNERAITEVADRMQVVVADGGRVHVAGTGHSTALVLETFFRAGGLACVNPISHPSLNPLAGAIASTAAERETDLAAPLLDRASPQPGEVGIVASNSGSTPLAIELARGLRSAGVWVVAMTSLARPSDEREGGDARLDAVVDATLDTGVPPGDAALHLDDGVRLAPLSSLTSMYLWNLVLARVAEGAARRGVTLPVWSSANSPGGDERNAALVAQHRDRIPALSNPWSASS